MPRDVTISLPSSPLHEVVEFSYIVQRVLTRRRKKSGERIDVGAAAAAMFVLTELQDTLRVPPQSLSIPLQDAITQEIGSLYFDKVSHILRFKTLRLLFACLGNVAVFFSYSVISLLRLGWALHLWTCASSPRSIYMPYRRISSGF